MPAIVTTGRDFSTIRPAYGFFWQQDSNLRISGVYLVRSPRKARSLNHSAILPSNIWTMPAIVTTGRVLYHQPPSLWTSLREQDFDPTLIRRIFSPFSAMKTRGLNHSVKIWSMPAIVTTGRDFSTIRPAYGLYWQQDSNLRISGVYLVRSRQ